MFNIKNLSVYLEKDLRKLIVNFNLTFYKGDKVVLIGEEGNGKSTLLKCLVDKKKD
ncbi:ATP-binding cassette domain-containing protein [Gemella cuniculi]|uniref:ATP-binding cassette domain-containing protein n=1 Tax=Gemella cuniculi TaxID=150240 RepID=UPI00041DAF21|nr:ATP-binding cassette domain-containing protein [Gemella cuniculi]